MSRSTTIIKSKYPKEETLKKIDDFFRLKSYKQKRRKSELVWTKGRGWWPTSYPRYFHVKVENENIVIESWIPIQTPLGLFGYFPGESAFDSSYTERVGFLVKSNVRNDLREFISNFVVIDTPIEGYKP